jgi:hypothetical protein
MGSFSDYGENAVLNHVFGKNAYTPAAIFIGLSTSNPGEDGSGLNEPTGNNYSRVETSAADWTAASDGAVTNADGVNFAEATGNWGTLTHFALFDAASGGHMLAYGTLTTAKSIGSGDAIRFDSADLTVTLD